MAESKLSKELSSLLQCPICMETIEKPAALPCLHFYCQKCINSLPIIRQEDQDGIRCPICNEFTLNTYTRHAYFIQNILDLYDKSTSLSHCGICMSTEPMTYCQQCKQAFCKDCEETHKQFVLFKNHILMPIDGSTTMVDKHIFCEQHQEEVVKLYCKDCNILVCLVCQATKHKLHQVQTVSEALQDIVPDVRKNVERTKTSLVSKNETSHVMEHKEGILRQQYQEIESSVEALRVEAIRQINETAADIQRSINIQRDKHTHEIGMHIKGSKRDIKHLENLISLAQESLKKTKDVSLLAILTSGLLESLQTADNNDGTELDWGIPSRFTKINEKFTQCFRELTKKYSTERSVPPPCSVILKPKRHAGNYFLLEKEGTAWNTEKKVEQYRKPERSGTVSNANEKMEVFGTPRKKVKTSEKSRTNVGNMDDSVGGLFADYLLGVAFAERHKTANLQPFK